MHLVVVKKGLNVVKNYAALLPNPLGLTGFMKIVLKHFHRML